MSSLEPFVRRVKPALDTFLRAHSKETLKNLESELLLFKWTEMKIFHIQILIPLVMKLEEINEESQELRTGTINCIRIVTSNLYLSDVKGLRTMLVILLRQIRDIRKSSTRENLSEEIKLATIYAVAEALRRSTTDVLEQFYNNDSVTLLGQLLLTLVEFIECEKYRQILIASMQCLMVTFYVHDEADILDVVLRNQVANSLFLFVPKVVSVLIKTSMADEKLGETVKTTAIKALGCVLCVICEEKNELVGNALNISTFKQLMNEMGQHQENISTHNDNSTKNCNDENVHDHLKRMQENGRCSEWFKQTSQKLSVLLAQTYILRSHQSVRIRYEYGKMCTNIIKNCTFNLKDSFICLLENVVALAEDNDESIRQECKATLRNIQENSNIANLFDDTCEMIFDKHLTQLPRVIHRCDDDEQYAEFIFIKGLLNNLSANKLHLLFAIPKNLEIFCTCLLSMIDMKITRDLLVEEYSLRQINEEDITECSKLRWRQYKHIKSDRCIQIICDICGILGHTTKLNHIIFEYLLELLAIQNSSMNEILLLMLWIATIKSPQQLANKKHQLVLVNTLMTELLKESHWYLVLQPDGVQHLAIKKRSDWYIDRTPGLYESALEIRIQEIDPDEERDTDNELGTNYVSIVDVQFNVLHTCIVLDILGHCATFVGEQFDAYLFRCLHHVLLRIASSNSLIYQAAFFALTCIQKALHYGEISQLIETHNDYITYHLKMLLKRAPDSRAAVDILSVVIQYSSSTSLPHFVSTFDAIQEECAKSHNPDNINSYLKVYNAFLKQIKQWHCSKSVITDQSMEVDGVTEQDIISQWTNLLLPEKPHAHLCDIDFTNLPQNANISDDEVRNNQENTESIKPTIPTHIEVTKNILHQIFKFLTCSDHIHQILSLECLISGIPLLKNYEDELLPLVHLIWQPLIEKFQQKNPIVLHRCFSLLTVLAIHAKDFILKRSVDDIIPHLNAFLKNAAKNSLNATITAQTQEYKLQLKLLNEFGNFIQSTQIEGRHLHDLAETIVLYLCISQPMKLQHCALQFFQMLRLYNGPLMYLIIMKRSHLKDYTLNTKKLLNEYQTI